MKNCTLTIILVLVTAGSLFAATPKSKLEWQKVPGVASYEVQVRNKITSDIKSHKTSSDHIWVDLLFGFYEMKIIAYDAQGRMVSQSGWIPLTVMKTYQPDISSMTMQKENRSSVELRGDNFFDQTTVSVTKQSVPVNIAIVRGDYPKKLSLSASLEKNTKYSMTVQNPGGYSESRILHVFENDHIMLFRNEYEYSRYFSPLFAEFSTAYQSLQSKYWNDTFKPGLTSFNLFAGYHVVSWFGVHGGLNYQLYSNRHTAHGEINLLHHYLAPNAGIFFCYKHKDYTPHISGSIGYSFSFLSLDTGLKDLSYESADLFYRYGIGVKIFVWRHLYIDPSFYVSEIQLKQETLSSYDFSVGLGWYF